MASNLIPKVEDGVNPNVGYCNSWLRVVNNAGRPLFAQSTYSVNAEDTNDLLTELINVIRQKEDDNGFDFVDDNAVHEGNYQTLKVLSACKISSATIDNTTVGNLTAYELPVGFEINGQIYSFSLQYGAVLAYKTIEPDRYENSMVGTNGKSIITITKGEGIVTNQG